MEKQQINTELKKEMLLLMVILLIICFSIAGLSLYLNLSKIETTIIIIPVAIIIAIFILKHMYKKGLLRPELKLLFEKNKDKPFRPSR